MEFGFRDRIESLTINVELKYELKIIQITDLNRFIQCYDPTLEIVDCIHHDFCNIEKNVYICIHNNDK